MANNIFALILAGGKGTRMGNTDRPKQFISVGGKPIILHTVEKFVLHSEFDKILVLSPQPWIAHTKDLLNTQPLWKDKVEVIAGGATRNETIMNGSRYIEEHFGLDEDTVIVTHDSVRPFVSHRMIDENIRYAIAHEACDTVIPATDTIVETTDHATIASIPDRSTMYLGQTPQSFKAKLLKDLYLGLTEDEKNILTDACKIMVLKGVAVGLIPGDVTNIKITYPSDIRMAESIMGGQ